MEGLGAQGPGHWVPLGVEELRGAIEAAGVHAGGVEVVGGPREVVGAVERGVHWVPLVVVELLLLVVAVELLLLLVAVWTPEGRRAPESGGA